MFRILFRTLSFALDYVYDWALLGTNSSNAKYSLIPVGCAGGGGADAEDNCNNQHHGMDKTVVDNPSRVVSSAQVYPNHGHHNVPIQQQQIFHLHATDVGQTSSFHSQYMNQSGNQQSTNQPTVSYGGKVDYNSSIFPPVSPMKKF